MCTLEEKENSDFTEQERLTKENEYISTANIQSDFFDLFFFFGQVPASGITNIVLYQNGIFNIANRILTICKFFE